MIEVKNKQLNLTKEGPTLISSSSKLGTMTRITFFYFGLSNSVSKPSFLNTCSLPIMEVNLLHITLVFKSYQFGMCSQLVCTTPSCIGSCNSCGQTYNAQLQLHLSCPQLCSHLLPISWKPIGSLLDAHYFQSNKSTSIHKLDL